jgi:hypothetical protein
MKIKCKNCGDLTSFTNADIQREKFGWCPACYRQWKRQSDRGWWDESTTIDSGGLPRSVRAKPPHPSTDS